MSRVARCAYRGKKKSPATTHRAREAAVALTAEAHAAIVEEDVPRAARVTGEGSRRPVEERRCGAEDRIDAGTRATRKLRKQDRPQLGDVRYPPVTVPGKTNVCDCAAVRRCAQRSIDPSQKVCEQWAVGSRP